jgi:hypothetical protein
MKLQKRNNKKALSYISAAKQWPENLGVGKPYDSDIDERLEDWFAYENYTKMRNEVDANLMLNKILSFRPQKTIYINTFSSANNLVTAWAMQSTGSPGHFSLVF